MERAQDGQRVGVLGLVGIERRRLPWMSILRICSAARPVVGGVEASPDGAAPVAAGGAEVDGVAPPHAAMTMAALVSRPKRRLCIYVLLRTG
jgi:hypothetical protein